MSKKRKTKAARRPQTKKKPKLSLWLGAAALAGLCLCLWLARRGSADASNLAIYKGKLALLEEQVLEIEASLGKSPAGGQASQAVFLSLCNQEERASVFYGTGADLRAAWQEADQKAAAFLEGGNYDPVWVKADVVYFSETIEAQELKRQVLAARHEFYRFGLAFDSRFDVALLEAELNGAKIYDYENGGVDLDYLNRYLRIADRPTLEELPEAYILFQCKGWFCDEENEVYPLGDQGLDYGRREVTMDAAYAKELILNASAFLEDQLREDGSFIYGIYPRFDNEIENYNIVRHASTLWSLICRYRLAPDEALAEKIRQAIDFMLKSVIYDQQGRAYLYEEKADEIKLGGCGVAVVALTEYMEVFGDEQYQEVCQALGQGILTMLNQETGEYYHVLNGDFSRKEETRTVYYDGEATFALCRLYSLMGDSFWLEAAQSAVAHFIRADYAQYKDHWVAYSMNELTKHISDNEDYYAFALQNAQQNLETIRQRDTTYHTYLELLMATFETYDRAAERGFSTAGLDLELFLDTVSARVNRQLNGYFFPEYAMYMKNPKRILNTFMVRHDGYRVRIDDVQHNIGGYYLYYKNYDKLLQYGLQNPQ